MRKVVLSKKDALPPPPEPLEEKVKRLEREIETLKSMRQEIDLIKKVVKVPQTYS